MSETWTVHQVTEALHDPRVQRALRVALRDRAICAEFRRRRRTWPAGRVIRELAAEYAMGEESIRSIVYHKLPALKRLERRA